MMFTPGSGSVGAGDGEAGEGARSGMEWCSRYIGGPGRDRVFNEISDQLRSRPSICRGQPLDTVPQRGRNPDRY